MLDKGIFFSFTEFYGIPQTSDWQSLKMTYDPLIYANIDYRPTLKMDNISLTTALATTSSTITTTDPTSTTMMSLLKSNRNSTIFAMSNKNVSLDITANDFRMFIEYMQIYGSTHECGAYCKGEFFKMLQAYTNIHGYVALMVSIRGIFFLASTIMLLNITNKKKKNKKKRKIKKDKIIFF